MTPEGVVLEDVSIDWGASQGNHRVMRQLWLPKKKRISGQVAVLASTGSANYYHWLFDVLPRLEILRKAGFLQNPNLSFILERPLNTFQRESLRYYGFELPRVFFLEDFPHMECEEMILPSLPGRIGDVPPWVCDFLRGPQVGLSPSTNKKNMYFITRRNTTSRNLLNEQLLLDSLASLGAQAVEPQDLPFPKQVALFATADVIIGTHGAGLANVVFCKPNSQVVELIPNEYRNKCYWALASNVALRYAYIIGEPTQQLLSRKETVSFNLPENCFNSIHSFLQRTHCL
jgi:capsular polysaccharide biosynthesis protein